MAKFCNLPAIPSTAGTTATMTVEDLLPRVRQALENEARAVSDLERYPLSRTSKIGKIQVFRSDFKPLKCKGVCKSDRFRQELSN